MTRGNCLLQETPWFPLQEEFVFIDQVEAEKRVRGTEPPAKKEECEVSLVATCRFKSSLRKKTTTLIFSSWAITAWQTVLCLKWYHCFSLWFKSFFYCTVCFIFIIHRGLNLLTKILKDYWFFGFFQESIFWADYPNESISVTCPVLSGILSGYRL